MDNVRVEQLRTVVRNLVRPGHMDMRQGRAFYELIDDHNAYISRIEELERELNEIRSRNTSAVEEGERQPKRKKARNRH